MTTKRKFLVALLLAGMPAEIPAEEILATYRGGTVTRTELAEAMEMLPPAALSAIESNNIRTVAEIEYLEQTDRAVADDVVLRMRVEKARGDRIVGLYTAALADTFEISEEELEQRFEEHRENFLKPERRRLRHIFQRTADLGEEEREAKRARMESIREELAGGGDFGKMAAAESEAKSRFDGGKIGNVSRGQMAAEVEEVLFGLAEGEISPVVAFGEGLHLFWCETIVPARSPTDEEIRIRIRERYRQSLYRETWQAQQEAWLAEARVDLDALRAMDGGGAALELGSGGRYRGPEVQVLLPGGFDLAGSDEDAIRKALRSFIVNSEATAEYLKESQIPPKIAAQLEWHARKLHADRAIEVRAANAGEIVRPDEEVLRKLYEENKEELVADQQYLVEWIAVRIDPETAVEDTNSLEALRAMLAEDVALGFVDAARGHLSASILERSQVVPPSWKPIGALHSGGKAVAEVVRGLEPGQTSALFRTTFGNPALRILRLHEIQAPRPLSFEESRLGLETFLLRRRIEERRAEAEKALVEEMAFQLSE